MLGADGPGCPPLPSHRDTTVCLPQCLPTLSSSSLPNLHSPPGPGRAVMALGCPPSAQSSMYHPPTSTQLCHQPPTVSHHILHSYPSSPMFVRMKIISCYGWLTFLRPRHVGCVGVSAGPGPNVVYKTEKLWAESRERRVWPEQRERMVGSEWAALGSLRHITLHYGRKPWALADIKLFSPKIMIYHGWGCKVVKNLFLTFHPKISHKIVMWGEDPNCWSERLGWAERAWGDVSWMLGCLGNPGQGWLRCSGARSIDRPDWFLWAHTLPHTTHTIRQDASKI